MEFLILIILILVILGFPENEKDFIPLYWACGVTPQLVLESAKIDISITHSPGKMFVTDLTDEEMAGI
ncbi:MAG: hypothetical protein Ct9H90mP2_11160 [Dehalococcoidia bacterium]|nr:MAG: hypothetical protein Ct9H90mP2_11160 [Dehalococcoidia bacterium]